MDILSGKKLQTEGTVWIDGKDLSVHPYARWGKVGFCSQTDESLEGKMTGREILEMFGRISMIEPSFLKNTVIPESLQLVGLKDMKNKSVDLYSQGDRRKLSFLLALLSGPGTLLLDSPSLGMDFASQKQVWTVITKAKREFGQVGSLG